MNIAVYVWKINNEQEKQLLNRIIETTLEEKEFTLFELNDLPEHKPSNEELLLCFGERAFNLISFKNPRAIKLPLLSQLIDVPVNKGYRLEAYEKLKQSRELSLIIEEDNKLDLKPEDIANNLTLKNKTLIRHLQDDKTECWIGTTALGKKVLISQSNEIKNIPCNFQLTFEELYAAKLAIELLSLDTLTLIKGTKNDNKDD